MAISGFRATAVSLVAKRQPETHPNGPVPGWTRSPSSFTRAMPLGGVSSLRHDGQGHPPCGPHWPSQCPGRTAGSPFSPGGRIRRTPLFSAGRTARTSERKGEVDRTVHSSEPDYSGPRPYGPSLVVLETVRQKRGQTHERRDPSFFQSGALRSPIRSGAQMESE